MDYELAKELKDAGWPQIAGACWILLAAKRFKESRTGNWVDRPAQWVLNPRIVMPGKGLNKVNDYAIVPTLSELIEACEAGKHTFALRHQMGKKHGWYVDSRMKNVKGSTPEEAVARLWLALNPKKV